MELSFISDYQRVNKSDYSTDLLRIQKIIQNEKGLTFMQVSISLFVNSSAEINHASCYKARCAVTS